jgi:metal-responsive CopG/Arc/MetJ family transcriptional regulator
VTVTVEESLLQQLETVQSGRSRSEVVEEALRTWLARERRQRIEGRYREIYGRPSTASAPQPSGMEKEQSAFSEEALDSEQ